MNVPTAQALLIELCTEELPPKSLAQLSASFSASILEILVDNGLAKTSAQTQSFASPRRLGVCIEAVSAMQAPRTVQRKGPTVKAAYDDNAKPTQAALGFARACGVGIDELGQTTTDQGTWLSFEQQLPGKTIIEIAQQALDQAIKNLPTPKRMRWGNSSAEFVRPVHKILALHGETILALNAFGLKAGRDTSGHRFHHPAPLRITSASTYADQLQNDGWVIADFAQRKLKIATDATNLANKMNANVVMEEALLAEVTGLVEWPVTLVGEFDTAFLDIPDEVLIASMQDHQKYFYLTDAQQKLQANFITVSNIQSADPTRVIKGNERVLRARLADAMFFWQQDKKRSLESMHERLAKVLFHLKLGSMQDKVERISSLAQMIGQSSGADLSKIKRAAQLCKNDLVSDMVGEFPSLQGTMGRYYALHDQEDSLVADAIEQHYWPKFAGDQLPQSAEAATLALSDRMDTLVGIFLAGEKPSAVKDPYALRRAALGCIRILIENKMDIKLSALIDHALEAYRETVKDFAAASHELVTQLSQFILDRLRAMYLSEGFSANQYNAIAACSPDTVLDFDQRIHAIARFHAEHLEDAQSLAAANKRIANILRKIDYALPEFAPELAQQSPEKALADNLSQVKSHTQAAFAEQNYQQGLSALAALRKDVDRFFDEIMVMDEDLAQRNNRLALLQALRAQFMQVADLSELVVEKS